jgi:Tfp pilus assembly protein PilN
MPLKKSTTIGSILTPIDQNQVDDTLLDEARSQKRNATNSPPRNDQDGLDQEIHNLEPIQQQVEKRKEKKLRVSQLQKQIDEALEQLHNMTQHFE